jgi:hypothetical protein
MWCHYNVISENSDITKRPWQRLAIRDNWNHLSAYVIWNILALNITGKVNKIVIKILTSCLYGIIRMILYNIIMVFCVLSTYRHKCVIYCNILWYNVHLIYLQDEFEDTKGVIHKLKDSKNHGQKKIDNWTNNDLQTLCHKTKDQATRTPLKLEGEFMCSGGMSSSFYNSDTSRVTLDTSTVIAYIIYNSWYTWNAVKVVLITNQSTIYVLHRYEQFVHHKRYLD